MVDERTWLSSKCELRRTTYVLQHVTCRRSTGRRFALQTSLNTRHNELRYRRARSSTPSYDTIRDAIITCARKPTRVSSIYRTEPTTKKCKTEKLDSRKKRIFSERTVNSLGNPCSESRRRKRKGCGGKDLQKRKVF